LPERANIDFLSSKQHYLSRSTGDIHRLRPYRKVFRQNLGYFCGIYGTVFDFVVGWANEHNDQNYSNVERFNGLLR
jgi:hypothetical protein